MMDLVIDLFLQTSRKEYSFVFFRKSGMNFLDSSRCMDRRETFSKIYNFMVVCRKKGSWNIDIFVVVLVKFSKDRRCRSWNILQLRWWHLDKISSSWNKEIWFRLNLRARFATQSWEGIGESSRYRCMLLAIFK